MKKFNLIKQQQRTAKSRVTPNSYLLINWKKGEKQKLN